MDFDETKKLVKENHSKILLLVMDGLGGLPDMPRGKTALEAAHTPNLDQLASEGVCGLHVPVADGITPGSGPSHLGLFGYDPLQFQVGRGVLSALGIDFDLQRGDVAARGNFCTVDEQGKVTDRRAGRISSQKNQELLSLLRDIQLDGTDYFLETIKEYRLLLVLRGEELSSKINGTDPQATGVRPEKPRALNPSARKTADLVESFLNQAARILKDQHPANMILLRGFSSKPQWPSVSELYGLQAAAIAAYPMYRGVAKLVGMQALETGDEIEAEVATLENEWDHYDYFFLHIKKVDSYGEDGNIERKSALIEQVDTYIPRLMDLNPDVLVVTGDHSTPAVLKSHSWHPVPVILWSKVCRSDEVTCFGERACMQGGLGPRLPSKELMPIALANAMRLEKFGA